MSKCCTVCTFGKLHCQSAALSDLHRWGSLGAEDAPQGSPHLCTEFVLVFWMSISPPPPLMPVPSVHRSCFLFVCVDSIAYAHSAGPGIWGQGPWAKGRPEMCPGNLDRRPLGLTSLWDVSWSCPGANFCASRAFLARPRRCPGEAWRGPGEVLEASWRSLGALKDAWSAKGGLLGAYGSLLEAS